MDEKIKEVYTKYKIEQVTRFSMDYGDFNNLVSEYLPSLTNTDGRFKDFECVAEFEWNNYSIFDATITKGDLEKDSFYDKFDRKEIQEGKYNLSFNQVLCFLIENKILPYGKYEVKVSW